MLELLRIRNRDCSVICLNRCLFTGKNKVRLLFTICRVAKCESLRGICSDNLFGDLDIIIVNCPNGIENIFLFVNDVNTDLVTKLVVRCCCVFAKSPTKQCIASLSKAFVCKNNILIVLQRFVLHFRLVGRYRDILLFVRNLTCCTAVAVISQFRDFHRKRIRLNKHRIYVNHLVLICKICFDRKDVTRQIYLAIIVPSLKAVLSRCERIFHHGRFRRICIGLRVIRAIGDLNTFNRFAFLINALQFVLHIVLTDPAPLSLENQIP